MHFKINIGAYLLLKASFLATSNAFSPNIIHPCPFTKVTIPSRSNTALNGAALSAGTEEEAMYLLLEAKECAHSDTCSIDQADDYLNKLVRIQGGCAAGTLSDVCEDISLISEVVADLREKIKSQTKSLSDSVKAENLSFASMPLVPVYIALTLLTAVISMASHNADSGVVPFTAQEWWWAIKDGYLNNMAMHYLRNGGLYQDLEGDFIPFTTQEWLWALKDGYLNNMFMDYFRNGGLYQNMDGEFIPFTPQEWWWSLKGGYLSNMIMHSFRNGGL